MWVEMIECFGYNQFFQYLMVEFFNIGLCVEVEQFVEIVVIVVCFNNCFDWFFVDVFDGVNVIDDFVIVVDVEMVQVGVNIWGQDFQFYLLVFIYQVNYFFGVVYIGGYYCCYKFGWVVCFKLQCLVGD